MCVCMICLYTYIYIYSVYELLVWFSSCRGYVTRIICGWCVSNSLSKMNGILKNVVKGRLHTEVLTLDSRPKFEPGTAEYKSEALLLEPALPQIRETVKRIKKIAQWTHLVVLVFSKEGWTGGACSKHRGRAYKDEFKARRNDRVEDTLAFGKYS